MSAAAAGRERDNQPILPSPFSVRMVLPPNPYESAQVELQLVAIRSHTTMRSKLLASDDENRFSPVAMGSSSGLRAQPAVRSPTDRPDLFVPGKAAYS